MTALLQRTREEISQRKRQGIKFRTVCQTAGGTNAAKKERQEGGFVLQKIV